MKKFISIELYTDTTTLSNILGGLAQSYRGVPDSAPAAVKRNIKRAIEDILMQLYKTGMEIMNPLGPFYSYAKLIEFEKYIIAYENTGTNKTKA